MLIAESPQAVAALLASHAAPPLVTVTIPTFEQLLDAGLLEARMGQFYYKDSKTVVQTERA